MKIKCTTPPPTPINTAQGDAARALSALVALVCVIVAYFFRNGEAFHATVTIVVLPLGCIWYGNEIGDFAGASSDDDGITGKILGKLITVIGWIVLLAMLAVVITYSVGGSR